MSAIMPEPPLLPALLTPAVRERIAQARGLRATLHLADHTGTPLDMITVDVTPPYDGALGCVLWELWKAMREAESPEGVEAGRVAWQRMTAAVDFPELPTRRKLQDRP